MTREFQKSASLSINIDEMRDLVSVGIRRASAFVRFGLDGLDERIECDFNLTSSIDYRFWPTEINKEERQAVRDEYSAWLVGSCLREVDLFFGLFLDRIWFAIELTELHGTKVPSDHVFDPSFARKTNVAAKFRLVAEKLNIRDYYDELNSLSLMRNSLAHHAGVVRSPYDCNNEDRNTLTIKWLAFEMTASRDGHEVVVKQAPFDTSTLPGEGEVQISLRWVDREVLLKCGNQIRLTNAQLAEVCMFYRILCDKAVDAYLGILNAKGIPVLSAENQVDKLHE